MDQPFGWLILMQLDLIDHQGLRIALEAFLTSLAQSFYVEAPEPSLTFRHLKLSLNCVLKLKCLLENPAYSYVSNLKTLNYLKNWSKKIHLLASTFYHTWRNLKLT